MDTHRQAKSQHKLRHIVPTTEAFESQNLIEHHLRTQDLAYQKARERGFSPRFEDQDWQAAELELAVEIRLESATKSPYVLGNHSMKRVLATTLLAVALPGAALAAASGTYGPQAGEREFTLSGTGTSDKDFDNSSIGVSGEVGWFLSDQLSLGVRQSLTFADIQGEDIDDDFWAGSTRGYGDYHFGSGRARPFVGASLGAIYGDGVNDTGVGGVEVGLKYYALPDTFILARAEYQFLFDSSDDAEDNFDDGSWSYVLGIGFNF